MTDRTRFWKIDEPTTTLTDVLLAGLTLWFATAVASGAEGPRLLAQWYWALAFGLTAMTALLGAYHHGISRQVGEAAFRESWRATLLLTGLSSYFLLAAPATTFLDGWARAVVLAVALLKAVVYLRLIRGHRESFRTAAIDSGLSLLGVGLIAVTGLGGPLGVAAQWILAGVAAGLVGGAIQASGLAIHRHFNHNDLFHVIHMVAACLLYQGVRLL